ncbi:hypothetical protein C814_00223, partial [Anaerotruncus sp. G3(2012)]
MCYNKISIHALREERDADCLRPYESFEVFQSTRSARSATILRKLWDFFANISIHALREERDFSEMDTVRAAIYFNPRAPRGARRG